MSIQVRWFSCHTCTSHCLNWMGLRLVSFLLISPLSLLFLLLSSPHFSSCLTPALLFLFSLLISCVHHDLHSLPLFTSPFFSSPLLFISPSSSLPFIPLLISPLFFSLSIGRSRAVQKQQSKERMFDIENIGRTTAQPPETFKMVTKKKHAS